MIKIIRLISMVLALVLIMSTLVSSQGVTTPEYTQQAETLKTLGLFNGTAKGFELTRNATRVEAAAMLVRLLGKETEAKNGTYVHPFTDVPGWANSSIGYLYANGLTKGVGPTLFGSNQLSTPSQYATFALRALGYDDTKGDFAWNTSITKGVSIGLFTSGEGDSLQRLKELPRGSMVLISYNSLFQNIKGTTDSLLRVLSAQKIVSDIQLNAAGVGDSRLADATQAFLTPTTVPTQGATIKGQVKIGDYISFGKYYGEPIMWKCVANDTDGIMLVSEYILCLKAFDAAESGTAHQGSGNVQKYGSNIWSNSNIREWLNSSAQTVSFTTQAPVKSAVGGGYNSYADEPGFLSNFSQVERDGIKAVSIDGVTDKVFLLTVDEVIKYFGDGERRKKITNTGNQKSEYKVESENNYWYYWTRSPFSGFTFILQVVGGSGNLDNAGAYVGGEGVVPALHLSPYIPINGTGTESDPWRQ